ncbi:hypothetical protein TrVE_jg4222 [Triparma verrucosa]|uniref:RING-type domain-containing protein n=1 Tax=Triparma verrucosa TaxID=1606542 RepID=A0A9W6ZEG5_9STRA|nr:hypothetical protein TrVE_jg4222 [Triparma verrucosa]
MSSSSTSSSTSSSSSSSSSSSHPPLSPSKLPNTFTLLPPPLKPYPPHPPPTLDFLLSKINLKSIETLNATATTGQCMFTSLAHSLTSTPITPSTRPDLTLRSLSLSQISHNPHLYTPYLTPPNPKTRHQQLSTSPLHPYLLSMSSPQTDGDHVMLAALTDSLQITVYVIKHLSKNNSLTCSKIGSVGRECWIVQVGDETHYRALEYISPQKNRRKKKDKDTTCLEKYKLTKEDINDDIICNICYDVLTATSTSPVCTPTLSKCEHTYCKSCLESWIKVCKSKPDCPVCKRGIGRKVNVIMVGEEGKGGGKEGGEGGNIDDRGLGSRIVKDANSGKAGLKRKSKEVVKKPEKKGKKSTMKPVKGYEWISDSDSDSSPPPPQTKQNKKTKVPRRATLRSPPSTSSTSKKSQSSPLITAVQNALLLDSSKSTTSLPHITSLLPLLKKQTSYPPSIKEPLLLLLSITAAAEDHLDNWSKIFDVVIPILQNFGKGKEIVDAVLKGGKRERCEKCFLLVR